MLIFLPIFSFSLLLPLPFENAISTRDLDTLLQDYAFKALSSPKTGLPYDAKLPNNLTGIKVSAMRLKSGSLRTRGVQNYKEFHIPIGVIEKPYNAFSTKNLDNLHASKALSSPKNELPYDAKLPNNLPGVQVSAMKLTSGVQNYKEESNEESSVVHLWKKSKKNKSKSKNKNKAKKMNKNLEAGLITALCLIGLCIVLIIVWLLVVKLRK
ncbi:putative transmembrane protein [Trifolium repens]|nr:putative transmembrane protein [Trifolium repens]